MEKSCQMRERGECREHGDRMGRHYYTMTPIALSTCIVVATLAVAMWYYPTFTTLAK